MKLLIITRKWNSPLECVCEQVVGEKIFCDYTEALEKLLVEEPTHVLVDMDGALVEGGKGNEERAQGTLRDIQQSASADQRVLATSFQRHADIGSGVESKDFLRMPYTGQQLEEFLRGVS